MRTQKVLTLLLALLLAVTAALPAATAEDYGDEDFEDGELSSQEDSEELADAEADVDTEDYIPTGDGIVYQEKTLADFDAETAPVLYYGKISDVSEYSIFAEKDQKSQRLFSKLKGVRVEVIYVGLVWVIVRYEGVLGYIKRQYLSKDIIPADPVNTAPFQVQKHQYIATVAKPCFVRKTMTKEPLDEAKLSSYWVKLNPGTQISIWKFQDGWAIVNYMRSYGYIDPNDLTDLIPVSPTDKPISKESPIAAYTSYYTMKHLNPYTTKEAKQNNINRIWNIGHGAEKITRTGLLQPGDVFNGNKKNIGPYREYKLAIGLVNGKAVLSSGGGTCQVSSTLYNSVSQLPGLTIIQRRPHGYGGASYLPIHCDAAVGSDTLNFVFRNDYDFPVQLVGKSSGDGALLMMIYRAD